MTQQYTDYQMFRNTYAFLEHIQYTRIRDLKNNIKIEDILYNFAGGFFKHFYDSSAILAFVIFNILGYVAAYNILLPGMALHYIAYLISITTVFIILVPWIVKLFNIYSLKQLKNQLNQHLVGHGLQGFIQLFMNDKYSLSNMKEKGFYRNLIIAHYENTNYLSIALAIIEKYYIYGYESICKDNQQEIFNNFFETSK